MNTNNLNTSTQELEQKLENISSSMLEILRGVWDVNQASYILLSLIFYKRILSLIEEKQIRFISLSNEILEDLNLQQLQSQLDPQEILDTFENLLLNLMQQHIALSKIFEPLLEQTKASRDNESFWQVIQFVNECDFSTAHFPIPVFGQFFYHNLYQVAIRDRKSDSDTITPFSINRLLVELAQAKNNEIIYDPSVGHANTLISFYQQNPTLKLIGEEVDTNNWAIAQMNLWANGIYETDILRQNALLDTVSDFPQADIAIGHFPFGMSVDSLTLNNINYLPNNFSNITSPILDGNSLFTYRILHQLNDNGRAFIIFPLQVTYKDRADKRLREFLLRRDLIESIISLPAGLLYATGTPISIWILRKRKTPQRVQKVLFINASNIEVQQKSKLYKSLQEEHIKSIAQAFRRGIVCDNSILQDNIIFVSNTEITNNQYNLNPKQYASPFIQRLRALKKTQELVSLNTIFANDTPSVWFKSDDILHKPLPIVYVQNLGASFAEYQLLIEELEVISSPNQITEARMLTTSALLINTEGKKLKLSYFEYKGQAILVSEQVQIFKVNDKNINLEYLFLQLHDDLVLQQINLYKSDHYLDMSLSEREFANLQILLPDKEKQDAIVKDIKIKLLRAEEQKVESLRQKLNLDKQRAQSDQNKIFSSLQHELGNRLPAILTEFKNLKDYVMDKIYMQTPLSLDEPLFPIFEGEELDDTHDTLGDAMHRIELLLRHTISTLDATSSIIKADKSRLELQYTNVKTLLEEVAHLYAFEKNFMVKIDVELDSNGVELPIYTHLDPMQLTTALVNLIENAKRHGFTEEMKHLIYFRLGMSDDKQEVIIDYQNDGKPFPEEFSFEDFISYGAHAGESGHSGIGGYLIYQIINNHEGTISFRTNLDRNDPFKVQFEITLPVR